jgi:hypothetical protein
MGLALGLIAGCAGPGGLDLLNRGRSLDDAQKRYTRFMRWAEFARASEYVDPAEREAFLARTAELGDVRFTDYELRSQEVGPLLREATIEVTYWAYRLSTAAETSFEERQHWYREESGNVWRVRTLLQERSPGSPG